MTAEHAVQHGYLAARVKGHAEKRVREWRKVVGHKPQATGQPNIAGWQQLADVFGKGLGTVQTGGDRWVSA